MKADDIHSKRFVEQELFIKLLASEGLKDSTNKKKIEYKNLANVAHKSDRLEFLREIVPRKITVKQYRELMAKKQQNMNGQCYTEKSESSSSSNSEGDSGASSSSEASESE